jgi:alpha-ketoglutarate-dependent taurine dioxygenase
MTVSSLSAALPFILEAEGATHLEALLDRLAVEREVVEARLLEHGAMLLRGWRVESVADLRQVVGAISGGAPLFNYAGGASPRRALGEGSYTSTEYPPQLQLSLHNELSYADVFPRRLYFLCLMPPASGGETTLGDSRRILAAIDGEVLDRFRTKGIRYFRNLSP